MRIFASKSQCTYPSQGHEMLFDAHTRAFTALGGIPRRGIYDNMNTAVDRVKKGKGRIVNTRFASRRRWPTPVVMTGYASRKVPRRATMRDVAAELKELRLHGMATAWDELIGIPAC